VGVSSIPMSYDNNSKYAVFFIVFHQKQWLITRRLNRIQGLLKLSSRDVKSKFSASGTDILLYNKYLHIKDPMTLLNTDDIMTKPLQEDFEKFYCSVNNIT